MDKVGLSSSQAKLESVLPPCHIWTALGWPGDLHIPKESPETLGSSGYDSKDIHMELRQNTSEDLEC